MLLRKLLLLRKPDYPAVVVFNADYIGRIWAGTPWSGENMELELRECF